MAEFAILVPVLVAFLGLTIDFSRVFQAWLTLESATRDAAEAAATRSNSSGEALSLGRKTVCLQSQHVPGFAPSGLPAPNDVEQCPSPAVTIVAWDRSTTAAGATAEHPVVTVTVESRLPFRPLFAYPFITQNGAWTITTRASFSIVQGRQ